MRDVEFKLGCLPMFGLYLGIGALCHAVFVGAQFDWQSAWTWGWLLGWPVMAAVIFGGVIAFGFAGIIIVGIIAAIAERLKRHRIRRRAVSELRKALNVGR